MDICISLLSIKKGTNSQFKNGEELSEIVIPQHCFYNWAKAGFNFFFFLFCFSYKCATIVMGKKRKIEKKFDRDW